ncbi:hypothetical protein TEA_008341 [Camellia sinensis var. sinensis]|uniref:CCDC93 coiled-coil domain-containing protein n=1 Tax=Camellia sinensis var. sinensis TaxID=542762 RepID=A0A4S4DTB7_CAMSN|nr:hypothetical protein TEA_008341 [Camellia sinensis var. sinensis]
MCPSDEDVCHPPRVQNLTSAKTINDGASVMYTVVTCTENSIEEEEHAFVQLQEELKNVGSSIDTLNTNLEQLNQRKANCLNKMQHLQERISREGTTDVVQRLSSLSQSLKALEMQESEHKSNCNAKYSKLQAEVNELENIICGNDDANLSHGINHSLYNSLERLNSAKRKCQGPAQPSHGQVQVAHFLCPNYTSAQTLGIISRAVEGKETQARQGNPCKARSRVMHQGKTFVMPYDVTGASSANPPSMTCLATLEIQIHVPTELAVKLREIVLLKRQLDDVPSQEELIQYEHRFSELYVHIQEKLRQTRELYATFNAMLEIKDLMLKETSLLNSISSQCVLQKLEKVRLTLEAERNVRDAVKQRYAAAIVEQRSCYSLLKAFQEECTKNERLRSLSSEILP